MQNEQSELAAHLFWNKLSVLTITRCLRPKGLSCSTTYSFAKIYINIWKTKYFEEKIISSWYL